MTGTSSPPKETPEEKRAKWEAWVDSHPPIDGLPTLIPSYQQEAAFLKVCVCRRRFPDDTMPPLSSLGSDDRADPIEW